jgi:putative ABC transport system permease protein
MEIRVASSLRRSVRNPLLVAHHLTTVGLGMAIVSAVVSLMLALLFQPLPFRDSKQLVEIWNRVESGASVSALTGAELSEIQSAPPAVFSSVGGFTFFQGWLLQDTGPGEPLGVARLDAAAFRAVDVAPIAGRAVAGARAGSSGIPPVWISETLWHSRFGGRTSAIGETIRVAQNTAGLYTTRFEIAGVLPDITLPHPAGAKSVDLWSILPEEIESRAVRARVFFGLGRLRSPQTAADAQAVLTVMADHRARREDRRDRPVVQSFERIARGPARRTMALFVMSVLLVLLLAFSNLASLTVAETGRRQAELAIQAALGADRWRLWRDLVVEQLALTLTALGLGIPLAWIALRLLTHLATVGDTAWNFHGSPVLDVYVMLLFSGCALAAALMWSTVIVRRVAARGCDGLLKAATHSVSTTADGVVRRGGLWRRGMLAFQACLGMTLMVLALSVTRTYVHLTNADLGRAPEKTAFFTWSPLHGGMLTDAAAAGLDEQILSRLRALPRIEAVAVAETFPPASWPTPFWRRGDLDSAPRQTNMPLIVSDGYFGTVGIPILFGASFTRENRYGGEPVAIVDVEMARLNWPSPQDAVNAEITVGPSRQKYRVIGVAASFTGYWARDPIPTIYLSSTQNPIARGVAILRAAPPTAAVVEHARNALREVQVPLEISNPTTIEAAWEATATRPRARMIGALLLALIGLALGAQGVHALVSSITASRRRELAIRSALGASRHVLVWLVMRPVLSAVAVGSGVAVLGIGAVQRLSPEWISSSLTNPAGPVALAATVLLGAVVVGAYLPVRGVALTTTIAALTRE